VRKPNPPTSAAEASSAIEMLTAGIPAQELQFYGISNNNRSLSLRNYLVHTGVPIARAPSLEQLQPAAIAAIAAMKKARRKAAEKEQREKTTKPVRRSTQMAGTRYRQAHAKIGA
jgi:hypothetical protein